MILSGDAILKKEADETAFELPVQYDGVSSEYPNYIECTEEFAPEGTNVDFIEIIDSDHLKIRTYERGVEDETLACGTGVTASAVFLMKNMEGSKKKCIFCTSGDEINVEFPENGNILKEIYLTGPAVTVFSGSYNII